MRRAVWRFKLHTSSGQHAVEMPRGAQIHTVACSLHKIEMWALVDPDAPEDIRRFLLLRSGEAFDVPDGWTMKHVGTWPDESGSLLHLFELCESPLFC